MYAEAMDADQRLRNSRRGVAGRKIEGRSPPDARAYWRGILELTKEDLKNKEGVEVRLAEAYAKLGENGRAMELLERAYEEHSCWIPFLRAHPHLDALHSDPRFQKLLRRIGL
jgi:hypothetical protein